MDSWVPRKSNKGGQAWGKIAQAEIFNWHMDGNISGALMDVY